MIEYIDVIVNTISGVLVGFIDPSFSMFPGIKIIFGG